MEEAGEAMRIKGHVHGQPEELLRKLPSLDARTLFDEVEAWIAAGEKLGQLEASRRAADAAIATSAMSAGPASVNRARMMWIRVVAALMNNLQLDEAHDSQIEHLILTPLAEAEAKADRRAESRGARPPAVDTEADERGADRE